VFKKMMLVAVLVSSLAFAGEQLVMVGSTTVLPIAQAAAEAFMDKNPSIDVTVRGGGSGVGIAALKDKTCNIANSSRPFSKKSLQTFAAVVFHLSSMLSLGMVLQ
jgi:phosphate transport system substrate-binding protein